MILSRFLPAAFAVAVVGICSVPVSAFATVATTLDAGYLRQNATTALPSSTGTSGALLLFIAAGGGGGTTFTATPSAGQYVAGGDVILGAASFNAQGGTQTTGAASGKETFNNVTLTLTGAIASAYIELRWYPGITLAQYNAGATPAAGSLFGAYNPLITNSSGNTTLNPDGDNLWRLPNDGISIRLDMYTTDTPGGGSQVPSEGYANFMVPAAGVPEPSAGLLGGLALTVMAGMWRVRRIFLAS